MQDFQDKFIRYVLRLAPATTKAMINWDVGMMPMKWRTASKKTPIQKKNHGQRQQEHCQNSLKQKALE